MWDSGPVEGTTWAALTAALTVAGAIWTWIAFRRRGAANGLRAMGFTDIAEGTVYALLVRVEKKGLVDVEMRPSEKGPPRKVYALNAQGLEDLDEFWKTWSFLAERLEQLHQGR